MDRSYQIPKRTKIRDISREIASNIKETNKKLIGNLPFFTVSFDGWKDISK